MKKRTDRQGDGAGSGPVSWKLLRLPVAFLVVNSLLLVPSWVRADWIQVPWFAFEAGVIVIVFALLPYRWWTRTAAVMIGLVVVAVTIVGVGDSAMWLTLGRPLNLYLDFWLLGSVWHLLTGALGSAVRVAGLGVLAAALLLGCVALVAFLLAPARSGERALSTRLATLAGIAWVSMGMGAGRVAPLDRLIDLPATTLVAEQVGRFSDTSGERERFAADLADAPDSYAALPGLLNRLADTDVILAFIESYGAVSIYDPRYAPVVAPRLDDLAARMSGAGLHVVTGTLVAPSQGGQSWFGHGSTLSGLWLDNQLRYDLMLASGRETLIDDFERSGHSTVALMPAITMAWPEGDRFGYDEIFVRDAIDYAGPPLNWVTMPDQFTWSFLQQRIRGRSDRPVFAELGLISSHAPWTPILPVLDDWESIGDGRVFEAWADAGESPEELWRDTDRVREQYARSVEYAVHAMTSYAERYVDDRTLLIAMGDHQPAPLITGDGATWEVPVHVISGDSTLLEPFRSWGFVDGAWPAGDGEALGMDYFRDWFVRAYSAGTD